MLMYYGIDIYSAFCAADLKSALCLLFIEVDISSASYLTR